MLTLLDLAQASTATTRCVLIPIYLLAVGICSGMTGLFIHQQLAEQGFVPTVYAGFAFVIGASLAMTALQLAYRSLLRFIWPTSSTWPLMTETLSMAACILFVPYLAQVEVNWPHSALDRIEPAVYLAGFLLVHLILKGISFFALLRSWPGTRYGVAGWSLLTGVCVVGSFAALSVWAKSVEEAKPLAPTELELYQAGNLRLQGRFMREGAIYESELTVRPSDSLLLLWSSAPADRKAPSPDRAFVTVRFTGAESHRVEQLIDIDPDSWITMLIAAEDIPEGTTACCVSWHAEDVPSWRTIPGLEPVTKSNLALLMSEPLARASQDDGNAPSVVLITVDGLSAKHMQSFGYERETTPNLLEFGKRSLRYPLAYTVSPDPEAAVTSMLTGRDPMRHGHYGSEAETFDTAFATISEALSNRGYFTLALTEGVRDGHFDYESGYDRAIDQFDDGFTNHSASESNTVAGGSASTIWKAEDWIRHYAGVKFFLWLRITDLQDPQIRPGYPTEFLPENGAPGADDTYDTVLRYVDHHLGELLRSVTNTELGKDVCVVLTSSYGRIEGDDPSTNGLTEDALHVPLMIYKSGAGRGERELFVQQDDLGVTIAAITGIDLGEGITGRDLLAEPKSAAPVSILPHPLRLSTRGQRFRLIWDTENDSLSAGVTMYTLGGNQPMSSPVRRNPYTVQRIMSPMKTYMNAPLERGLVPVNLPQE